MGVGLLAVPALAHEFPSTNEANRDGGFPHVNLVSETETSVTLEFVNDTNSLAFFEYRVDGIEPDEADPHPVIEGDVIHDGVSVDGRGIDEPVVVQQTFEVESHLDVRLALGGERDWDFDWVRFEVEDPVMDEGPSEDRRPAFVQACDDLDGTEYRNRGQCVSSARANPNAGR